MAYGRSISWNKTYKGFSQALSYAGEHLTGWAREWMQEAVNNALASMDSEWGHETVMRRESGKISRFGGDRFHPWYTGNLHDSVVGIVSDRHRTVSIEYMPHSAQGAQEYNGNVIIGRDCAMEAAQQMARTLHLVPGTAATIAVGVPYAGKVDQSERHAGFIRELSVQFASNVEDYFTIKAGEYRTRVFVTK